MQDNHSFEDVSEPSASQSAQTILNRPRKPSTTNTVSHTACWFVQLDCLALNPRTDRSLQPSTMAAQAPFFYHNPDSVQDHRQHDMFTPQPSAILRSSPMHPQDLALQQYYMSAIHTPKPMYKSGLYSQEPHVLSLETEFSGFEEQGYPRTPGLSTTSSTMNSPPQSSYLPTPTNGFFENLTGVKEGCEREVKSEILSAGIDWSRSGSPPLTPGT